MILSIAFLLAAGLAGSFAAAEDPPDVTALKPLYLCIEVMIDELQTIPCRIDASDPTGKRYDRIMLDLDGDGEYEKKQVPGNRMYGESESPFGLTFPLNIGDMEYSIDMSGYGEDPVKGPVWLSWALCTKGIYLCFINGQVKLYNTTEEAASGKALRIGPPFRFEALSTTRGPAALINVRLKDANGCTLRVASLEGDAPDSARESRIRLTFEKDGKTGSSLEAEYG